MTIGGTGCPELPPSSKFSHTGCVWSVDAEAYRRLKEGAYINHDGAGLFPTCLLMLIYPGTVCFQQLIADAADKHLSRWPAKLVGEFGCAVLPLTIAFATPHTAWLAMANLVWVCAALVAEREKVLAWPRLLMRMRATRAVRKEGVYAPGFTHIDAAGTRLRFVAEYRAVIMITTCIVILAVDFPSIFPRSHAKTEEYGYSLMDLGTGCIVCASAVVSRAARGVAQGPCSGAVLRRLASIWPLLLMGLVRLVVLSGMDYHVPTSEYGVHWNFFFTLAVVAIVATALDLGQQASVAVGVVLLVAYELLLTVGGFAEYILHAPRTGLFSANREGIMSCAGYLGIHWLSVGLGSLCVAPSTQRQREAHGTARRLLMVAGGALGVAQVLDFAGLPASHRMCNLAYAVLVIGVDALVLGTLAFLDLYWPWTRRPLPHVYGGVQESMLVAFLLGNLLTGAVNVAAQPLLMPPWAALLTLAIYSFVLFVPLGVLRSRGKALKLS